MDVRPTKFISRESGLVVQLRVSRGKKPPLYYAGKVLRNVESEGPNESGEDNRWCKLSGGAISNVRRTAHTYIYTCAYSKCIGEVRPKR